MKKKENIFDSKKIIEKAKKKNLIKHVSEAFKEVDVKNEVHEGNFQYFCDFIYK